MNLHFTRTLIKKWSNHQCALFISRVFTKELGIESAQLLAYAGFRFNLCFSVALHLPIPKRWALIAVSCLFAHAKKTIDAVANIIGNAGTGNGLCIITGCSPRFVGSVRQTDSVLSYTLRGYVGAHKNATVGVYDAV